VGFSPLEFRSSRFDWSRAYIVGVVNVTPDSFSDGGRYFDPGAAIRHAVELIEAGADIVDIGGESTRPQGATAVSAAEEIERVVPVVRALRDRATVVSIDTTKADVAAAAVDAGAEIINDISGGLFDPGIVQVAERSGVAFVCGHVRGRSLAEVHAATDPDATTTPPGFDEVARDLTQRLMALSADLRSRTIVDPGIGFGKGTAQNLEVLRRAGELRASVARPVMVGPSRKRFIGEITGQAVGERDGASVAACLAAVSAGADFLRIHDVKLLKPALLVYEAIRGRAG